MSTQNPVFIPGPTNIPERLLNAMHAQTRDHRAPDFVETLAPRARGREEGLRHVGRPRDVVPFQRQPAAGRRPSRTRCRPGDAVLVARYGMFSHPLDRSVSAPRARRARHRMRVGRRRAGEPLRRGARRRHGARGQGRPRHAQTRPATGVVSDIAAVRRAMDASNHPALLFVDCVSSLASMPFDMDGWGVDVAVAGLAEGALCCTPAWPSWRRARRRWKRPGPATLPAHVLLVRRHGTRERDGRFPVHAAAAADPRARGETCACWTRKGCRTCTRATPGSPRASGARGSRPGTWSSSRSAQGCVRTPSPAIRVPGGQERRRARAARLRRLRRVLRRGPRRDGGTRVPHRPPRARSPTSWCCRGSAPSRWPWRTSATTSASAAA